MLNEIICLGDNITSETSQDSPKNLHPNYPQFLEQILKSNNKYNPVINAGISGESAGSAQRLVNQWIRKIPTAKYFIMCFGTVDLISLRQIEEDYLDYASQEILRAMDYAVASVKSSPHASRIPLIMNLPSNRESIESNITNYNKKLKEYCQRIKIPFIDINSKLKSEHFSDNSQPNEAGARLIADEAYKIIENML